MNWRIKYLIETEAILESGSVDFKEVKIIITQTPSSPINPHQKIIEILITEEQSSTIEDAYVMGIDIIEEFLDRFCLISYSQAFITTLISVCKEQVKPEEEFEFIQMQYLKERKLNKINPNDLLFKSDESSDKYLRLLRYGMTSFSQEEKLLRYFSLLEQIAQNESEETIKKKCSNCEMEFDTGMKKTNNFISTLLSKHSINKKESKKITGYRGKIAHGGGRRSQEYFLDVDTLSARLETPAYKEVLQRIDVEIKNGMNVHMPGYPINKNTFKFDSNGGLIPIKGLWKSHGLFSKIDTEKGDSAMFGVPTDGDKPITPEPIALPDLVK